MKTTIKRDLLIAAGMVCLVLYCLASLRETDKARMKAHIKEALPAYSENIEDRRSEGNILPTPEDDAYCWYLANKLDCLPWHGNLMEEADAPTRVQRRPRYQ